jgi:YD repeat-containing protein
MDSLKDSMDNETTFAFDADSRLAEVNHPVEDLQTRYRYDLVGKLLETRVALDSEELWNLSYDYNLAGERLRQVSRWEDGGNCFEYRFG